MDVPTANLDPEPTFKIGRPKGREALESGLRLKASVAQKRPLRNAARDSLSCDAKERCLASAEMPEGESHSAVTSETL
jgi:hypothetical protein